MDPNRIKSKRKNIQQSIQSNAAPMIQSPKSLYDSDLPPNIKRVVDVAYYFDNKNLDQEKIPVICKGINQFHYSIIY